MFAPCHHCQREGSADGLFYITSLLLGINSQRELNYCTPLLTITVFMYSVTVCHLLQTQLKVEKKEDQIEHK